MKPRQTTGQSPTMDNAISIVRQHARVLAGNVSFGNGSNKNTGQNLNGVWASGTTPSGSSAGLEFSIPHVLGRVPVGFIVTRINDAGTIYDSGTTWTDTEIFVKSDASGAIFSMFII